MASDVAPAAPRRAHPHIPLIVLSGLNDEEIAVEALHNGAQDYLYLVKGKGGGDLISRAMRYAIERKHAELQLIESKEAAEAASRAKSAFLANLSHELRTPLNAVIGFSEIIANSSFGPQAFYLCCQYAGHINASGQHLLELVNEILDLSKLMAIDITVGFTERDNLTIAISDQGIGMRSEDIPTALEPFRQITSAQALEHEGTGLGLPLPRGSSKGMAARSR